MPRNVNRNGKRNDNGKLLKQINKLVEITSSYDSEKIKEKLKEIVPEYEPLPPESIPLKQVI